MGTTTVSMTCKCTKCDFHGTVPNVTRWDKHEQIRWTCPKCGFLWEPIPVRPSFPSTAEQKLIQYLNRAETAEQRVAELEQHQRPGLADPRHPGKGLQMSAVGQRTRKNLEAAKAELLRVRQQNASLQAENAALRKQNQNIQDQCHLAYLEGVDQGRASAIKEAC